MLRAPVMKTADAKQVRTRWDFAGNKRAVNLVNYVNYANYANYANS